MADTTTIQVIETVSSLKNISLSQDLKIVGIMLNKLKKSNLLTSKNCLEIISKIPLNSNLEKIIVMEVINLFRLSDEIIKALKSDDLFIIAQALKCSWFFTDDCNLLTDCHLVVNNFLSHLSISSRQKVLKNYSRFLRDETKAENLFSAVEADYGTKDSLILLSACSENFISSILKRKVNLSDMESFQLYLYHPAFTMNYISSILDEAKQNNTFFVGNFKKIFLRLISKDTKQFMEIFNKYGDLINNFKLGRILTKKIVKTDFNSILLHVDNYMKIFELKSLMSCLSLLQIRQLHLASMPATLIEFKNSFTYYYNTYNFMDMLTHMSKTSAQEMMLNNFIEKYHTDPLNVPFELNQRFIEYLPKSYRSKWAEKKISGTADMTFREKANHIAYLESNSLNLLKKMLPEALSTEKRCDIIESMLKSIRMNLNFSEVNEVILFVVERLRNDVEDVQVAALSHFDGIDLLQLKLEHWTNIMHLIDILKLNHDTSRHDYIVIGLIEKYIRRRLMDGLEVEDQLKELFTMMDSFKCTMDKGDSTQHFILNWFNDNLKNKKFANVREKKSYVVDLFLAINEWNSKYPQTTIPQKDWVIDFVFDECFKTSYYQENIIKSVKRHPNLKKKLFDSTFPDEIYSEVLLHKLHYDPIALLNNIEVVFDKIKENHSGKYRYFLTKLKMYNKGELVVKLKENCIVCLKNDEESGGNKSAALVAYSYLCSGPEYLSIIEPYYPEGPRAETSGEKARLRFKLQTAAATSLNNINPPYTVMPALMKFAQGDFLKITVGSLLGILTRTSQNKSLLFINDNIDSPVSFRKHVLRLHKVIAPKQDTCKLFFRCFETEKNISMRVILLEHMFSLLKEDETEAAWTVVKAACQLLTYTDIMQTPSIFKLSFIPERYVSDYIEVIWLKLDELRHENDIRMKIFSLITSDTVKALSEEFCTLLFHLTYTSEKVDPVWNQYISLYLFSSSDENLDSRLSLVIELICSHFKGKWDLLNEEFVAISQVQLSDLLDSICSRSLSENHKSPRSLIVLTRLKQKLLEVFSEIDIITDIFNMSLHIEFLKNEVTVKNFQQVPFMDQVCSLVDYCCTTYGEALVIIFLPIFRDFISGMIHSDKFDVTLLVVYTILTNNTSKRNQVMALHWLQSAFGCYERQIDINRFREVIKIITCSNVPEIKILSNCILRKEHVAKMD